MAAGGSTPLNAGTQSEELVLRFQAGDPRALERLWARYLPRLKVWARGRLPPAARGVTSTDDLVQDAFVRSIAHLRTLQPRGTRSVFAYFKTIILNQIRDHARMASRRPRVDELVPDEHENPQPSPLEELLGAEALRRYEEALAQLPEDDQDLIVAFVELRCSDQELAELLEKPSANAARMARGRALARLARAMRGPDPCDSSVRSEPVRRSR
jgi:RNA polymerase sigma factor (sigma-70 family)